MEKRLYIIVLTPRIGDYERANRYVHQALADVQFYNTRLRKLEIGDILPIIEEDRYKAVRSQRNWFMAASLLFVGLLAVILYAYFAIHRKNHKLDEWREFCKWIETLPYAEELIIGD